jgi:hypothetical protein
MAARPVAPAATPMIEVRGCPICGGELVSLDLPEDYDLKALGTRVRIEYGLCRSCAFVCQTRALLKDELMRYYRDSPKLREGIPSETDAQLYGAQSAFMQQTGDLHGKRVLDVGADMGKLLDHLSNVYGCKTFYQEENATARSWLEAHGRHVNANDAAEHTPYDWIILSQLLEHVVEPVPFLIEMRGYMACDGKLFVEVPNHGFWDDADIGLFFEHVNYFSPASLSAALDRSGYNVLNLEVTKDAHYFNGTCRIIRVCAQRRPDALAADPVAVVRAHEHKHKWGRLSAIDALSKDLMHAGRPGLALYGAADLAGQLFRRTGAKERIAAIFDSDVRKHGTELGGVAIKPPSEIVAVDPKAIVILSSAETDIARTIAATGYRGRVVCWSAL